jgi:hypothetical protein
MQDIWDDFRGRYKELGPYLRMLQFADEPGAEITSLGRSQSLALDPSTLHVLKASVFLYLYNLVESTVTACLRRVSEEIRDSDVLYGDLVEEWQRSWLQVMGQTDQPLSPANRLTKMLEICGQVSNGAVIDFQPKGAGGNLDDRTIEKLLTRYGITMTLPKPVLTAVKSPIVNDDGLLKLIKNRRNDLAHGLGSFSDCGKDVSVPDLRKWTGVVIRFLCVVVRTFEDYLSTRGFMRTVGTNNTIGDSLS